VEENVNNESPVNIESFYYFASPVFKVSLPQYIDLVREVSEEAMELTPKPELESDLYPSRHSITFHAHEKITDFSRHVIQIAWNLLGNQGYNMQIFNTVYESMWLQEHHKMSAMEQHIHSGGIQLVGFYFWTYQKTVLVWLYMIQDQGKVQIDLPEHDEKNVTFASKMVNFQPQVGDLFFMPSWLPHSFTRHGSDEVLKFVHINVAVQYAPQVYQNQECSVDEPVII
jgi:hypothetical protein